MTKKESSKDKITNFKNKNGYLKNLLTNSKAKIIISTKPIKNYKPKINNSKVNFHPF